MKNGNNTIIENVSMNRAPGYGQYTIAIDIVLEGTRKTIRIHSTDSGLYDALSDLESNSERLEVLKRKYIVQRAIEDAISEISE